MCWLYLGFYFAQHFVSRSFIVIPFLGHLVISHLNFMIVIIYHI